MTIFEQLYKYMYFLLVTYWFLLKMHFIKFIILSSAFTYFINNFIIAIIKKLSNFIIGICMNPEKLIKRYEWVLVYLI